MKPFVLLSLFSLAASSLAMKIAASATYAVVDKDDDRENVDDVLFGCKQYFSRIIYIVLSIHCLYRYIVLSIHRLC